MSLDVKTGVVYGFYINLSAEVAEKFEEAGFVAYPVTYRADEVDEESHDYAVGIPMMDLYNVGQSSECSLTTDQLNTQFLDNIGKLSNIIPDLDHDTPAILVTSYYY